MRGLFAGKNPRNEAATNPSSYPFALQLILLTCSGHSDNSSLIQCLPLPPFHALLLLVMARIRCWVVDALMPKYSGSILKLLYNVAIEIMSI